MADVIYWGNGDQTIGEYPAPKDVSLAEKKQGQKLTWNSGEIYTFNPPITYSIEGVKGIKEYFRSSATDYDSLLNVYSFRTYLDSQCNSADDGYRYYINYLDGLPPFYNASLVRLDTGTCGSSSGGAGKSWRLTYTDNLGTVRHLDFYNARISNVIHSGLIIGTIPADYQLIIDDSIEELARFIYSEEPSGFSPSYFCVIAITYFDSTTEEIPLGICPEWVRIRKDDECPENTCRVECADHYCCYGCDGKPVKEIPK